MRLFQPDSAPKRLATGLRPDPLGELTALPEAPWLHLRRRRLDKGRRTGKQEGRAGEERMEGTGGKQEGGERWGKQEKGQFLPSIVSKSRRL